MDRYSLAFSISNLGPKSYQKILNKFGTAEKGWSATESGYQELGIGDLIYKKFNTFRQRFDINSYIEKLEKEKVEFVSFTDKHYPKSLKKMENSPIGLYCKGNVKLLYPSPKHKMTSIGVVGTRKITQYGRDVTELLVANLVQNGVCIVSGLALGVDGLAHRATLENNGLAIAVLACGVDCCSPSENYSLYKLILENNGLIVSEYPLSQPPNKGTFLARNRIVAALSDGVLITEAAEGSGSLITAAWGLQLEKKVFAVPGPITSKMSDGSLKLLKKGAILVQDAQDILREFKTINLEVKFSKTLHKNLTKDEKKIVSLIENEELTIDEIAKKTKMPMSKLFVTLSHLELSQIIHNANGKWSI